MRITVLGCGNSTGVPRIGCECPVCLSDNPKNKRSRVSVLVEEKGVNLLIDTAPDLREQALKNNIKQIDAILYTHDHADHTMGIDDIRAFNNLAQKALPAYGNANTINILTERFPYIFSPKTGTFFYGAALVPHLLAEEAVHHFNVLGLSVISFDQVHAKIKTLGYRIGNFAYSTDLNQLPESAFAALEGVEIWLVDCLRYTEAFSHSHLEQTLGWINRVKPRLAILTHMDHEFDYDKLSSELPAGVIAGYDGMVLEL